MVTKTPKKQPAKRAAAVLQDPEPLTPPPPDAADSYEEMLADAKALPKAQVKPFHTDAHLARHNAALAVAAIVALKARVKKELPSLDLADIERVLVLAVATEYAAAQVARPYSTGQLAKDLHEARVLRKLLLDAADLAARSGLVPAAEVQRILAGTGAIDTAQDLVDLAALFAKYAAALKAKTPITAAQLARAKTLGNALLAVLKPKGATPRTATQPTVDLRDRLGSMLVEAYKLVRKTGFWLFGEDDVDASVPPLFSRQLGPHAAKAPVASGTGGGGTGTTPAATQALVTKKKRKAKARRRNRR